MNLRDPYFAPTLVLLSAQVILAGIGGFLVLAVDTPWPIRGLGIWVLGLAGGMGWVTIRELMNP